MRHLRSDYNAIQPFPTKRPHIVRIDGKVVDAGKDSPDYLMSLGKQMDPLIPDDEPVFLLRGQDPAAAATVRTYAANAQIVGADPEMVAAIERWADVMQAWATRVGHSAPDVPDGAILAEFR